MYSIGVGASCPQDGQLMGCAEYLIGWIGQLSWAGLGVSWAGLGSSWAGLRISLAGLSNSWAELGISGDWLDIPWARSDISRAGLGISWIGVMPHIGWVGILMGCVAYPRGQVECIMGWSTWIKKQLRGTK